MKACTLPFPTGKTFYGDAPIDTDGLLGDYVLGKTYDMPDIDWKSKELKKPLLSNAAIRLVCARNCTGQTVHAGSKVDLVLGHELAFIAGLADDGYPVDEWLRPEGCRDGDICYVEMGRRKK